MHAAEPCKDKRKSYLHFGNKRYILDLFCTATADDPFVACETSVYGVKRNFSAATSFVEDGSRHGLPTCRDFKTGRNTALGQATIDFYVSMGKVRGLKMESEEGARRHSDLSLE